MVASGVSQQPRWVPHVTGSPWLITIIKWRDLREESFPSQARQWPHVIHHSHHHQPPASDSSNQSNWRQDKREREGQCWWHHHQASWGSSTRGIINVKVATAPRRGILFSHDYHHFALVFAPAPHPWPSLIETGSGEQGRAHWGDVWWSELGIKLGLLGILTQLIIQLTQLLITLILTKYHYL